MLHVFGNVFGNVDISASIKKREVGPIRHALLLLQMEHTNRTDAKGEGRTASRQVCAHLSLTSKIKKMEGFHPL